jgi:hypothetical protein
MITSVSVISRIVENVRQTSQPNTFDRGLGRLLPGAEQRSRATQAERWVGRLPIGRRTFLASLVTVFAAAAVAACGLNVESPDLFTLSRTGQGKPLTLLVNDSGTIRCDGGKAKALPDPLLLDARDLADDLNKDAQDKLHVPSRAADSVFSYKITLQQGTVSFSDTAARSHPELARAELFAVQAAHGPCGLSG